MCVDNCGNWLNFFIMHQRPPYNLHDISLYTVYEFAYNLQFKECGCRLSFPFVVKPVVPMGQNKTKGALLVFKLVVVLIFLTVCKSVSRSHF